MMKKIFFRYTFLISILLLGSFGAKAQCDSIASICSQNFTKDYLSDGQQYRALLIEDQTAEFHLTLYGQSTYRFGACSGLNAGNLIFRVYDSERNEIFSNTDYANAPYWDFKVQSTLDIIVEANLNEDELSSGCAVLLVGFKP
ncbi:MAG: hypothetical protein JKY48_12860 [Flavobacteriales bacterium]|nr:hypothetical protein [Flavobacteriales bacterium]